MLKTEFLKHVYRTARALWRDGGPHSYSSRREAIESALDGCIEWWQG